MKRCGLKLNYLSSILTLKKFLNDGETKKDISFPPSQNNPSFASQAAFMLIPAEFIAKESKSYCFILSRKNFYGRKTLLETP